MTRFIYALREIRPCLEAEILTDVQQRLDLLSRDMDNHNGHRVLHQPTVASQLSKSSSGSSRTGRGRS